MQQRRYTPSQQQRRRQSRFSSTGFFNGMWWSGWWGGFLSPWLNGLAWPASVAGGALLSASGNQGWSDVGSGLWWGAWSATTLLVVGGYVAWQAYSRQVMDMVEQLIGFNTRGYTAGWPTPLN